MRPERLELSGFASFREHTEVDFREADLFVLTGPTGAGKSSIIDAMVFALYGSVPRYAHKSLVAPAITQGRNEARARLDFLVGEERYTAVRVARRTGAANAQVAEARLQQGERVLASGGPEVTREVERLLGLTVEHFQRCVVLPQGAFARFLHDSGAERGELLVKLLDLGIYDRMRQAATQRQGAAKARAEECDARLANELKDATPEALARAQARQAEVEALRDAIEAELPRLAEHEQGARAADAERALAAERAGALRALRTPAGVAQLAEAIAAAETAATEAAAGADRAREQVEALEAGLEQLPARDELRELKRLHGELGQLAQALAAAVAAAAPAAARSAAAHSACEAAEAERDAAEAALNELKRHNAAIVVSRGLARGDTCPVCGEVLKRDPVVEQRQGYDAAERRLEAAKQALRAAQAAATEAERQRAAAEAGVVQARGRHGELVERLAGKPSAEEVAARLDEVERAFAAVEQARTISRQLSEAARQAQEKQASLGEARDEAWRRFASARDGVAALGAPPATPGDLGRSWQGLEAWAAARAVEEEAVADAAGARAASEREAAALLKADQAERCEAVGFAPRPDPARAAVAEAARCQGNVERLERELAEAERVRASREAHTGVAQVAGRLAFHLKANGFEQWYLSQSYRRLTAIASQLLRTLSSGQYSLVAGAENEFRVVDHNNAGEQRPVRTLSGGETFLASLALALGLRENLAEMAAANVARLEAIFLDEGFGTLDPDTLDVVATALEELGAGGRMVGLVTHVKELAERLPVRFEVRKEGASSRVTRVDV